MKIKLLLSTAAIASLLSATPALATTTDNGVLDVTASVSASCSIGDGLLAFGAYNGITKSAKNGSAIVAVTCTNGTPYDVYSQTAAVDRKMSDGSSHFLTYKLFTNSGRLTELGVDTEGATIADSGSGSSQDVEIFGTIDGGQAAVPGSYEQADADVTIEY